MKLPRLLPPIPLNPWPSNDKAKGESNPQPVVAVQQTETPPTCPGGT